MEYTDNGGLVTDEDTKRLILAIILQAKLDYLYTGKQKDLVERQENAEEFIYNDEYKLLWGDLELSARDFFYLVDIEIDYFRRVCSESYKNRHKNMNRINM